MISVILLQFIYYIHSRKKLYIPGVTISTRSYDIGTLPNEGGSLINVTSSILKQISENDDIDKNEAYENYYNIILPILLDRIKYFPKVEQYLILNRLNISRNGRLDKNYLINNESLLNDLNNKNKEQTSLYDEIKKSFFEFVKQNERRTTVGLGCILKVAEKYGAKNLENYELLKEVKKNLKKIYEEQEKMLEKEFFFINDIKDQLNEKKILFYNISVEKCNSNQSYDDCIEHFKMTRLNLSSFIEFAKAKNNFNYVLHKNVLLAQINIGIMIGCNGGINYDSGLSSYKGIGINEETNTTYDLINGSRTDGLTQNGYNLSFGFGFGNSRYDNMEPIIDLLYYGKFKESYLELRKIFNIMSKHYVFKDVANLGNVILNKFNHAKYIKNDSINNFYYDHNDMKVIIDRLNDKKFANASLIVQLKEGQKISPENSQVVYDNESITRRYKNCGANEICYYRINSTNKSNKTDYKIYNEIRGIYTITNDTKDAKTFRLIYLQEQENYINIQLNGTEIEPDNKTLSETLNACFGVIYSGGKNDKDVCRNVFKETCGNELDYRCKESGLYDILTENPPSNESLPEPCRINISSEQWDNEISDECQYWFYTHMTSGNIELKPSAIVGFSLLVQANDTFKKQYPNTNVISENIDSNNSLYNSSSVLYKWYIPTSKDLEDETERAAYFLIENSGYIKVYTLLFFLLSIFIF